MGAVSTKNTKVCIVKGGATGTAETPVDLTMATATTNAILEVADTTAYKDGDVVKLAANTTGVPALDGGWYTVKVTSATELELLNTKGLGVGGTFTAGAAATAYAQSQAGDFECLCLSGFTFSPESPETIQVGTYCDPTAQIAGQAAGAGTAELTGYANVADSDYKEMLAATEDGQERYFRIILPSNGFIVFRGTFSGVNWEVPLSGATGYTFNVTLTTAPKHVY